MKLDICLYIIFFIHIFVSDDVEGHSNKTRDVFFKRDKGVLIDNDGQQNDDSSYSYGSTVNYSKSSKSGNSNNPAKDLGYPSVRSYEPSDHELQPFRIDHSEEYEAADEQRGSNDRIFDNVSPTVSHGKLTIDTITSEEILAECAIVCDPEYFLCNHSCQCFPEFMKCEQQIYCEDEQYDKDCVLHNERNIKDIKEKCELVPGHIMCPKTYICIADEWLCDGDDDCGDYSDETRCGAVRVNCSDDQFECQNGLCIQHLWVCDGDNDCKDYSDEMNCTKIPCSSDEYQCGDGNCVSTSYRCDGHFDCMDRSDEIGCATDLPECAEGEFLCRGSNGGANGPNARCILLRYRCDGDNDCGDWSDEEDCRSMSTTCSSNDFKCDDGTCIPNYFRCDLERDCDAGEDERECKDIITPTVDRPCTHDEFTCKEGHCIMKSWVCDGSPDCKHSDDEVDCPVTCEIGQFKCEPPKNYTVSKLCVIQKHVCDGYKDCPNGDDEKSCPSYKKCDSKLKCEQLCTVMPDGKEGCDCKVGYILQTDGIKCTDIDECEYSMNPVCSQTCINTLGSYRCDCLDGYLLRPDLRTCKALGGGVKLIMANRGEIRQVSMNANKYTSLIKGLHNAIAIDYHYRKSLLFWTDVSTDVVKMAFLNGTNIKDVVKWGLESPGGIAVDWVHDLVFWTDSGTRRIGVSNFDGTLRSVVAIDKLNKPRAIVIHPGEALVFWTDWGNGITASTDSNPKIEKAYMDGSGRAAIIQDGIYWPNGLTIDYTAGRIYWADAKHHVIESCKFDGLERKKVLSAHLPHPFALTIFEDVMFWTDWHMKAIASAHKLTGKGFRKIHEFLHYPMDIHSFHESRQPLYPNRCAIDRRGLKGGCSHMCIPNKLNRRCMCPIGYSLKEDQKTCSNEPDKLLLVAKKKDIRIKQIKNSNQLEIDMVLPLDGLKSTVALDWCSKIDYIYWTDVGRRAISRAQFNGSHQQQIIHLNLEAPAGLAIDWITDKLYYTDSGTNRIEVATIDGAERSLLIWQGLDKPRDIVLNPMDGIMYWSDWGTPSIESADMDGKNRKILVSSDLQWPNGLAIDYPNKRLYFTDGGTRTIEYVNFNGRERHKLLTSENGLMHPFGLDVYDNKIFWTDWDTQTLEMIDGKGIQKTLMRNVSDLMDIRFFHRERPQRQNPCQISNGGCSHMCLLNSQSHSCACPIGVNLQDDQRTCADSPSKYILFSERTALRQISLDVDYNVDLVMPLPSMTNTMSMDVDILTGDIYWADSLDDHIMMSSSKGDKFRAVIFDSLDSVDGLCVDSVGRKIYWADGGRHTIEVSELNGQNRNILIWKNLKSPRGIAIDYDRGFLFWTDWALPPKIERSWMDGDHRETIVSTNLGWPNCLTLYNSHVFWTDAQKHTIEFCDYYGKFRRTIASNLQHPYGIAVTKDLIYWTDWKSDSLHSMKRSNVSNQNILKGESKGLMDVKVIDTNRTLHENVCANTICSHLCLRNPNGFSCKCSLGINLKNGSTDICDDLPKDYLLVALRSGIARISFDTDYIIDYVLPIPDVHGAVVLDYHYEKSQIFYADVNNDIIRMVDMKNMSKTSTIISTGLATTNGIAVDWLANNLFWSDTESKIIEVSRLDGTSRKAVITKNLNDPRSIIIYPQRGFLFWCEWSNPARIERASFDGSNRKVIVDSNLGFPTGLAIDFQSRRLYWVDALEDRIEICHFDGKHRSYVLTHATHPFGSTIYQSHIYWTDWFNKTVYRTSKDGSGGRGNENVRHGLRGALDIRSVSLTRQPFSPNPCIKDNGGCTHLCLYIVPNYICACPDKPDDRTCKTEPAFYVPLPSVADTSEYLDEDNVSDDVDEDNMSPGQKQAYSMIAGAIYFMIGALVIVVTIIIALYIHNKKQRPKLSHHGSRNSVMTFSNPNYGGPTNPRCANNQQDANNNINNVNNSVNTFRRMKYDIAQDRVSMENCVENEGESCRNPSTISTIG